MMANPKSTVRQEMDEFPSQHNQGYHCFSDRDNNSSQRNDEVTSVHVYDMIRHVDDAGKPSNLEVNISGTDKLANPEDYNKKDKIELKATNNHRNITIYKARNAILIVAVLFIACVLFCIIAGLVVENIISKKLDDYVKKENIRAEQMKTDAVGEWRNWGSWNSCSKTCGFGSRIRSRKCDNLKPSVIGAYCEGLQVDTDVCLSLACTGECEEYLVSGTHGVPDSHMTASTSYPEYSPGAHMPYRARLNNLDTRIGLGGWSAGVLDKHQWIQAEFFNTKLVTGVATQGRDDSQGGTQWVQEYQVLYSGNCIDFHYTRVSRTGSIQVFQGNSDVSTIVNNTFVNPVWAKCIRIQPISWHDHISLRFDVLGCTYDIYRLIKDTL